MEATFFGVRGSIPAPGPSTVRYGGNTSCVAVRLGNGELIILDCGTGARNLGLALLSGEFGQGRGSAAFLLSHAHWDHIQGFPFFVPFYTPGNRFMIYGGGRTPKLLEEVLEGQMAAQYFPVQTIKNMAATLEVHAVPEGKTFAVGSARVSAHAIPHGPTSALAFRIEEGGKVLAYASDAGYHAEGPSAEVLAIYRGADLLIHDATFTPEDRAARLHRGLSSVDDAVDAAVAAEVRRLALFHYDQDYTDHDVDQLMVRARQRLAERGAKIEIIAAAEGLSVRI
jgi:phosphoribosyl 1,2-cyclic phosphodiesterase